MVERKIICGRYCPVCRIRDRYDDTKECVGCVAYRNAVMSLNIDGVDGRKPVSPKKPSNKKPKVMSERGKAISQGRLAAKYKRGKLKVSYEE